LKKKRLNSERFAAVENTGVNVDFNRNWEPTRGKYQNCIQSPDDRELE
jgi:hypothetical protein